MVEPQRIRQRLSHARSSRRSWKECSAMTNTPRAIRTRSFTTLTLLVFVCAAITGRASAQGRGRSGAPPVGQPSLAALAGDYRAQTQIIEVRLRADGILTIVVPPQPARELQSLGNLRFEQKGLPGYIVEFLHDSSGNPDALIFHQPNG